MTEFVGRTGAMRLHSYPETRRGGGALQSFGRNFAWGPASVTPVDIIPIQVPWETIASGAPAGTDVPITLVSTGIICIRAVLCFKNQSDTTNIDVFIDVQIDGVSMSLPATIQATAINPNGSLVVPVLAQTDAIALGAHNVQIQVGANADSEILLVSQDSSIEVQEVPAATG